MLRRHAQFLAGLVYGLVLALLITAVLLVVSRQPPGHPIELKEPPTPTLLRVHVTGAVIAPGVYALPQGSIWQDAIDAAGGATPLADLSRINLARVVSDGDQVAVPEIPPILPVGKATASGPVTPDAGSIPSFADGKVNINTAGLAELDTLPEIGPTLAQRIIDYRLANGPFLVAEDITMVRGIGPATYEKIKDMITVGP